MFTELVTIFGGVNIQGVEANVWTYNEHLSKMCRQLHSKGLDFSSTDQIIQDDKIMEDEMGGAYFTSWWKVLKETDCLEGFRNEGKMILKWILKKNGGVFWMWFGFM